MAASHAAASPFYLRRLNAFSQKHILTNRTLRLWKRCSHPLVHWCVSDRTDDVVTSSQAPATAPSSGRRSAALTTTRTSTRATRSATESAAPTSRGSAVSAACHVSFPFPLLRRKEPGSNSEGVSILREESVPRLYPESFDEKMATGCRDAILGQDWPEC